MRTVTETASTSATEHRPWDPGSWREHPALQQPDWGDPAAVAAVVAELGGLPGLVQPAEVDTLRGGLAAVADGRAIALQAGTCAERFADCTEPVVRSQFQVILQMAVLLSHGSGLPVVKLGRIAGQFGKPRSRPRETVNGVDLPVYRGDVVNGPEPTPAARRPDPWRMRRGYDHACATLNSLYGLVRSGFAAPERAADWNQDFVRDVEVDRSHEAIADEVARALRFGAACRADAALLDPHNGPVGTESVTSVTGGRGHVFVSHEGLLLPFEQALTRWDPMSGRWYALSAHQLWIGDRTRDPDGAHVEFLSGVANPVGLKLGPTTDPDDLLRVCERLDPDREPGRLVLISRMGADVVVERMMPLVEAVTRDERRPVWLCDPMHGNTVRSASGYKTRNVSDVVTEIEGFFAVHRLFGTHPGGLHLELAGSDVTECVGGNVSEADLPTRYETVCDPRLNAGQSVELAFRVAALFRDRSGT